MLLAKIYDRLGAGAGAAAAAAAINRGVHKVKVECCIDTRTAMRLISLSSQTFGPSESGRIKRFRRVD